LDPILEQAAFRLAGQSEAIGLVGRSEILLAKVWRAAVSGCQFGLVAVCYVLVPSWDTPPWFSVLGYVQTGPTVTGYKNAKQNCDRNFWGHWGL